MNNFFKLFSHTYKNSSSERLNVGNVEKINPAEVLFLIFLEIFPIPKHTFSHFTPPLPLEYATHLVPQKNIFVEL